MNEWGDLFNITGLVVIVIGGIEKNLFMILPSAFLICIGFVSKWLMLPRWVETEEEEDA